MKKILITGGAGYIGSHTAKTLSQAGYEIVVLDNLVHGYKEFINWGVHFHGDILNLQDLDRCFQVHGPIHALVHMASYINVGDSVKEPIVYYQNNVSGSINVMEVVEKYEVPYILFSSTAAVYGNPEQNIITEDHPLQPLNPYGVNKLLVERLIQDLANSGRRKYFILRYFNACGADPNPQTGMEIGEDHKPETHLLPLILHTALGLREKITIFGSDYPTNDGTAVRDYIHVNDIANAHLFSLNYMEDGGKSGIVNLGNGKGYSVREVIEACKDVVGSSYPINVEIGERRAGDSAQLVANGDLANKTFDWKPRYANIREIIEHAWKWHKMRHGQNIHLKKVAGKDL